jgi:hypothetical protein
MRTDQNEKAPDALAGDLSAVEINQPQYEPDFGNCQEPVDPVIPELIGLARRAVELYELGVLRFDGSDDPKVQMNEEGFLRLFSFGEWKPFDSRKDCHSTTVEGVEFFCLAEKGKHHDLG